MKDMDSVGPVGGGQMVEILDRGMLETGLVEKDRYMVADRDTLPRQHLHASYGIQTVFGTAKLMLESGDPAPILKGKVTSPGGTSFTGLQQVEQDGFRGTPMTAVEAATRCSKELGS